jgi:purine-nucleoside/S-methyl-5'-thioadenosine phosphorylase / adenosine deaminase
VRREERDGLAVYRFDSLPAPGLDAFVSTRTGGVSASPYASLNLGMGVGDEPAAALENRRRLFSAFDLSLEHSVWGEQVHGGAVAVASVVDAGRGSIEQGSRIPRTDAIVTGVAGLTLCLTLADCAPVVLYDPERAVLGLAHAGWRGAAARIASRAVEAMRAGFGSDPADILAAVGPSIGPGAYEVGEEVVDRAREAFGERSPRVLEPLGGGKARFDLWAANALDLEEAGVDPRRIEVAGISTGEALDRFYSHRAEGRTGRFIAAATLRSA